MKKIVKSGREIGNRIIKKGFCVDCNSEMKKGYYADFFYHWYCVNENCVRFGLLSFLAKEQSDEKL